MRPLTQNVQLRALAVAGNGSLRPAYRAELRDVMQYVVRTDQMSSWAPGERTDLWMLSWDAAARHFRGAGGGDGTPTQEVRPLAVPWAASCLESLGWGTVVSAQVNVYENCQ